MIRIMEQFTSRNGKPKTEWYDYENKHQTQRPQGPHYAWQIIAEFSFRDIIGIKDAIGYYHRLIRIFYRDEDGTEEEITDEYLALILKEIVRCTGKITFKGAPATTTAQARAVKEFLVSNGVNLDEILIEE